MGRIRSNQVQSTSAAQSSGVLAILNETDFLPDNLVAMTWLADQSERPETGH
jgi:hypothetical protein